ncbi:helix-turn-helix domain-containing protein [Erysipelotrichaceae bacterium Oil+RF-744-GAM-WT-6]|jgi:AbrB family looped-hinge helix DNA binding protein|uniref:Helix-turn-helix domain-containing protein n=1 Tax=Stecheria intestinalis TaxID=2606630 RepID=A0A7X2NTB6_9FIRM|nr:helix-turn-helix domain-containing protein [Stecheria intestinalis]MCI6745993.1 helix-turn-helix domain-containing protein [Anaerolactibacter massiliensis]MDY3233005.1 helix-turn-helix domain-containing protein [Erysipelotrichaceae bacterium]MDD5880332.1 helix-turn-helix domain-containing protein [Stecheria intestinalis]MDD6365666.1 helix-turn-helix domain-containing protein [Stecheria intestinalis]MDD7679788.1 helix-turn-helix domain-containing protein [Stecheria intestinalis]
MFKENLIVLRKRNHLSQEELAEKIGVSRQTLSKYETGESLPDIGICKILADLFGVTLDDLVNYENTDHLGFGVPPAGKHVFGLVTVGEHGQIVLPEQARTVFRLMPGDQLLVLGEEEQGIALIREEGFLDFVKHAGME